MQGFEVLQGGPAAAESAQLGQLHHVATGPITSSDVITELTHRGYTVAEPHAPVHVVHVQAPALTKSMAISVSIDEGLSRMGLPRTSRHPYRCPSSQCGITSSQWTSLISWCVTVSNGYLAGRYGLPSWASNALHAGTLRGTGLSGVSGLGALSDWIQDNAWLVQSVGTTITNYGAHLTAKNIEDAIKANTDKAVTKDDMLQLIAALQQQGKVPAGQGAIVAEGANMAASSSWTVPLMIGGAVVVVMLLMKK